jgi:uncharacterized protein YyaL (SSP411 family)
MTNSSPKNTNLLINESSPYLLQHAHNPVNWHAWNEETLEKAKKENKLIIVSIGYSACHWCHVMEHESFENDEVAKTMNDNFICIKVDRQERPDVDQVYMDAIHLIGGRGGWPLNCFALPDGRPFWGGTYFPREQWIGILNNVVQLYDTQKFKLEQQADDVTEGIRRNEQLVPENENKSFDKEMLEDMVHNFSSHFDNKEGGTKGAPKFPMPNNYLFLLRYYTRTKKSEILDHIELTLHKMASGGIYDQIGGGFARYSVDDHWHIPHFEKMLYDNAQLVSLYSEAYRLTKKEFYKQVIIETLDFIKRELTDQEGGFYSSLDADSEGEEGKFYVWEKDEIKNIIGTDIVFDYFGIDRNAFWEDGKNVPIKAMTLPHLAEKYKKTLSEIAEIISNSRKILDEKRSKRIRPALDDKILTSWNALMLKGYIDAYRALGSQDYLDAAEKNASFILRNLKKPDGGLFHNHKNGGSTINGFLEDYAFVIEAFISLYQASFDLIWLTEAKNLLDYTIKHFNDPQTGMFYFTSDESTDLIARKFEINDNVIPASNSCLANSLFQLSQYYESYEYQKIAEKMLSMVKDRMITYPSSFSNWGILALNIVYPYFSVAICGENAIKISKKLNEVYLPNILLARSTSESHLPLLKSRLISDKTLIYVCSNQECKSPVETVKEAMDLIKL